MAAQIQYPYAFDEDNNLVYIKDVKKEHRYDHQYHCPNCGGEMLPRLGENNAHCFAHAGNQKCSGESYLHKAAKLLLAKRFNERSRPFKVGLTSERPCIKLGSCQEEESCYCRLFPEYKEYDLIETYDLPAEVEVDILEPDGITHFTPDALLRSSSPKRNDIFIEVYYKHKVTKQKKESGHQIIEIRIRKLADLRALEESECLKESTDIVFYNFKPRKVTPEQIESYVRQSGESASSDYLPPCKRPREIKLELSNIHRFTLYKSGKTFNEPILEDERHIHHPSAVMDIVYDKDLRLVGFELLGLMAMYDRRARTCMLCEHCVTESYTWCNLIKNGSSRKGTFDKTKGITCHYFEWTKLFTLTSLDKKALTNKDKYTIWVNPNIKE